MNFSCGQWNPLPWHLTCTGELTPGGGCVQPTQGAHWQPGAHTTPTNTGLAPGMPTVPSAQG